MLLTNNEVKGAQPRAKDWLLSDGTALFLLIRRSGRKEWLLRFWNQGSLETTIIGSWPLDDLETARRRRDQRLEWAYSCPVVPGPNSDTGWLEVV